MVCSVKTTRKTSKQMHSIIPHFHLKHENKNKPIKFNWTLKSWQFSTYHFYRRAVVLYCNDTNERNKSQNYLADTTYRCIFHASVPTTFSSNAIKLGQSAIKCKLGSHTCSLTHTNTYSVDPLWCDLEFGTWTSWANREYCIEGHIPMEEFHVNVADAINSALQINFNQNIKITSAISLDIITALLSYCCCTKCDQKQQQKYQIAPPNDRIAKQIDAICTSWEKLTLDVNKKMAKLMKLAWFLDCILVVVVNGKNGLPESWLATAKV